MTIFTLLQLLLPRLTRPSAPGLFPTGLIWGIFVNTSAWQHVRHDSCRLWLVSDLSQFFFFLNTRRKYKGGSKTRRWQELAFNQNQDPANLEAVRGVVVYA